MIKTAETNFLELSNEILEVIFLCFEISGFELGQLCRSCKRLNQFITCNSELWKQKLFQKWPAWISIPIDNFQMTYKMRNQSDNFVAKELRNIMNAAFHVKGIPMKSMMNLCEAHDDNMVWECLIATEKEVSDKRMDQVYCARRVNVYIYSHKIKTRLLQIVDSKNEKDKYFELEKGYRLLEQWLTCFKKDYSYNGIDYVKSEGIFQELLNEQNLRSLLGSFNETFSHQRLIEVISLLNSKIFHDESIQAKMLSAFVNPERDLSPIFLTILYLTVAKAIGVQFEIVFLPSYCILRYVTSDGFTIYIDAYKKGRIFDENEFREYFFSQVGDNNVDKYVTVADTSQIFCKVLLQAIQSLRGQWEIGLKRIDTVQLLLETLIALDPEDEENRYFLARLYLHQGINKEEAVTHLTYLLSKNRDDKETISSLISSTQASIGRNTAIVKRRSSPENEKVEYRVGTIMRHVRYDYDCVIFGWDYFCDMPRTWQRQMGVDDLPSRGKQPFYNVLANDGSTRYASQESLEVHKSPSPISIESIGKYFRTLHNNRYLATEMLLEMYPEDYDDVP